MLLVLLNIINQNITEIGQEKENVDSPIPDAIITNTNGIYGIIHLYFVSIFIVIIAIQNSNKGIPPHNASET